LDDAPTTGEAIGWSESNAVIYANSVLGARTEKHPDYLDLFIAMTGRAPNAGVYLTENRMPASEVRVVLPESFDDAIWPMLGWLVGVKSSSGIPVLTGLEETSPTEDDLKACCTCADIRPRAICLCAPMRKRLISGLLIWRRSGGSLTPQRIRLIWWQSAARTPH
jgi:predicted aconitase